MYCRAQVWASNPVGKELHNHLERMVPDRPYRIEQFLTARKIIQHALKLGPQLMLSCSEVVH